MTIDRRWGLTLLVIAAGCSPPQMGNSDAVFNAVDALYTAVTARDIGLLEKCATNLADLKSRGELTADASDFLNKKVIDPARAGSWQPAAEELYAFMKAQRRDGPREHSEKKAGKKR